MEFRRTIWGSADGNANYLRPQACQCSWRFYTSERGMQQSEKKRQKITSKKTRRIAVQFRRTDEMRRRQANGSADGSARKTTPGSGQGEILWCQCPCLGAFLASSFLSPPPFSLSLSCSSLSSLRFSFFLEVSASGRAHRRDANTYASELGGQARTDAHTLHYWVMMATFSLSRTHIPKHWLHSLSLPPRMAVSSLTQELLHWLSCLTQTRTGRATRGRESAGLGAS